MECVDDARICSVSKMPSQNLDFPGWTLLYSGRLLPTAEDVAQCGEGVEILLSPVGFNAWYAVGDAWCAVSSRIVSARVKLASAVQRQAGGGRCSFDIFLTVISVYLPTVRAPRHIKGAF